MRFRAGLQSLATAFILIWSTPNQALEIACRNSEGTVISVNIPPSVTFEQAMEEIQFQLEEQQTAPEYLVDFMAAASRKQRMVQEKGPPRDYRTQLKDNERKQIDYIVSTLGNASLLSIAKSRSDLKKAGEQIERIHPFRFLEYVFENEKLRAALQNMSKRSWVWKEFFEGIKRSLEEEIARGNLLNHVSTFASKIKVAPDSIKPLLEEKKWKEFLNVLFEQRPRAGNFERYDM